MTDFLKWVREGNCGKVCMALNKKPELIKRKDKNRKTALELAVEHGHENITRGLIDHLIIYDAANIQTISGALDIAVKKNDANMVDMLSSNTMISNPAQQLTRSLLMAASYGREDILQILIRNNADINSANVFESPLMAAAVNGHINIVNALINCNANTNAIYMRGKTALMLVQSVEKNGVEIINLLINANADINAQTEIGQTALMLSATIGNETILDALINCNAKVDLIDKRGESALIAAVEHGHESIVHTLLANKADLNLQGNALNTPLMRAVFRGHENIFSTLMKNNADLNLTNSSGETAVMLAAEHGRETFINSLITNKANVNTCSNYDMSALSYAARNGKEDLVNLLIRNGAKQFVQGLIAASGGGFDNIVRIIIPKITCQETLQNAIHRGLLTAAIRGHGNTARLLIAENADVEIRNIKGQSPLMIASIHNHHHVVSTLIEINADPDIKDMKGSTALMHAVKEGNMETVLALMRHGADPNIKTKSSKHNVLMMAVKNRSTSLVTALLTSGSNNRNTNVINVDINARDKEGNTAAMIAINCGYGYEDVFNLLIAHKGMDVNARNNRGMTSLMIAASAGEFAFAEALIEYRADVNASYGNGRTSLMEAVKGYYRGGCRLVFELLIVHGADVDAQTSDGMNAFLFAALHGRVDIIRSLINNNSDVNAQEKRNGATALIMVAMSNNVEIAHALISNGADVNIRDKDGYGIMNFCHPDRRIKFEAFLNYSIRENFLLFLHGSGFAYRSSFAEEATDATASEQDEGRRDSTAVARLHNVARCFEDHYWVRSLLELLHVELDDDDDYGNYAFVQSDIYRRRLL